MTTKIIGNQIDAATRAIVTALDATEQLNLPDLNQSQIDALGTPAFGTLVYNTTEDEAQIYKQDASQGNPGWDTVGGGGPSIGEGSIIRTNGDFIAENLTVGSVANGGNEFTNGFTFGEVTINNGYTVTVENGASWTVFSDKPSSDYEYKRYLAIPSDGHFRIDSGGGAEFSSVRNHREYFTRGGTVPIDYSLSTYWYSDTGNGSNYTINLTNIPTDGGTLNNNVFKFVFIIRGGFGSPSGYITGVQVNGASLGSGMGSGDNDGSWSISNNGNPGTFDRIECELFRDFNTGGTARWRFMGRRISY
tara:strand:+ start:2263 stop:3177 length:915 start_codon:yes stop_codon:yes gene_type:complete